MGATRQEVNLRITADGREVVTVAKQSEQALDGLEKRVAKVGQTSAQITSAETQLERLKAIEDQQQAQIAQQAAIQAALQEQLDGIRSNTGATAAAVAASRSAPVAAG